MTREHELLKSAVSEIRALRNENKLMGARLDMFDKMMALFYADNRMGGMATGPDLVWEIEKHIELQNAKVESKIA